MKDHFAVHQFARPIVRAKVHQDEVFPSSSSCGGRSAVARELSGLPETFLPRSSQVEVVRGKKSFETISKSNLTQCTTLCRR